MKQNYTLEELESMMNRNDRIVEIITTVLIAVLVAGICWL